MNISSIFSRIHERFSEAVTGGGGGVGNANSTNNSNQNGITSSSLQQVDKKTLQKTWKLMDQVIKS